MRSFFQKKFAIVLLAALALGALTVLALSLDNIPFKNGQPFGHSQTITQQSPVENMFDNWDSVPWWQLIGFWVILTLLVVLIGLLLSPELRKRLLLMFIRIALTFLAFWLVIRRVSDRLMEFQTNQGAGLQVGQPGANPLPVPTFQPTHISPLFSYLVSFAFALVLLVVLWILYRGWQKYAALKTQKPLNEIARIARSSLNDLSAGRDSSDVIINCYLRMSDVVADKRHLRRDDAMTPQEFALRLERAGLPGDAVRRLTRLFEIVRYGDRKSAPKDVNEAVSCLSTILHYCGETS